jgi:hypothetical protein
MSKKSENTKSVSSENSVQNVKWYFFSPSGSVLHSREYPAGKVPLGAIWVSVNGASEEFCYRTSTIKGLYNADKKAVSQENGYTLTKDGVTTNFRFIGETAPLAANDQRVLDFLAAHQSAPTTEPTEPKSESKPSAKKTTAKKPATKKTSKK